MTAVDFKMLDDVKVCEVFVTPECSLEPYSIATLYSKKFVRFKASLQNELNVS